MYYQKEIIGSCVICVAAYGVYLVTGGTSALSTIKDNQNIQQCIMVKSNWTDKMRNESWGATTDSDIAFYGKQLAKANFACAAYLSQDKNLTGSEAVVAASKRPEVMEQAKLEVEQGKY